MINKKNILKKRKNHFFIKNSEIFNFLPLSGDDSKKSRSQIYCDPAIFDCSISHYNVNVMFLYFTCSYDMFARTLNQKNIEIRRPTYGKGPILPL